MKFKPSAEPRNVKPGERAGQKGGKDRARSDAAAEVPGKAQRHRNAQQKASDVKIQFDLFKGLFVFFCQFPDKEIHRRDRPFALRHQRDPESHHQKADTSKC